MSQLEIQYKTIDELKMVKTRKYLYGNRQTTLYDWCKEITDLLRGNPSKQIKPLTLEELADTFPYTRQKIAEFRDIAISVEMVQVGEDGKLIIPKLTAEEKLFQILEKDTFTQKPEIKAWIDSLLAKNNGEGIKNYTGQINKIRCICNNLKINPRQLILDPTQTKTYFTAFVTMLKKKEVKRDWKVSKPFKSIAHERKPFADALASFCNCYNIHFENDEVMNRRVVGHGKYADTLFTESEYEFINKKLQSVYGVDHDYYRIFWTGIQSCARHEALMSMVLKWEEIPNTLTNDGSNVFIMKAFESKTKKINNGIWNKFITKPELQESLTKHQENGHTLIWSNKTIDRKEIEEKLMNDFRDLYFEAGKIPDIDYRIQCDKDKILPDTENYFYLEPIHTLRHCGAHYWLEKTDYNYGVVAEIGGWNTIDELKKSYGAMPARIKMKKIFEAMAV